MNSQLFWFALYVNSKAEKRVDHELYKLGMETFLPLYTKVREYRGRKRKSNVPLIPNYVFVKIPFKQKNHVYNITGVINFVKVGQELAIIPTKEIEILKKISGLNCNPTVEKENYFEAGQKVIISDGPLSGLNGEIIQRRGKNRFLIKIHTLHQALSIEISRQVLSTLNELDVIV